METQSANEKMVSLSEETVRELFCDIHKALEDVKYGMFDAAVSTLEAAWRTLHTALYGTRNAEEHDG